MKTKKNKGFTLIELALVILSLSVLFVILFGVNFTVSNLTRKQTPISQQRSQALLTLNQIQNSIRMVYYFPEIEKTVFFGKSKGFENNRSDQLTLTTISLGSEYSGGGIVKEVSFYLKKDNISEMGDLYIREDQIVDENPYIGGNHYKLLENVKSFQLNYSLNGVDWVDNWSSKSTRRIPRLVKISIKVQIAGKIEDLETIAIPGIYLK
ncbi:MAG: type II secretion system protein GspJ [Leptonema sp. (in: bacteria)]